ncbi:sushi, von Willebrand factor type A, EGF and pentraxin domain-containing protein 1 isoform X2 [Phycodurus eques]|uniref:sushi, von Willebrand factor type A, EGF and pentraxin domain-containing protein 1 isoform X2 n=1 Tax=Phycodurus eques TaxID=693459 RepID=UPI002ACD373E|nr:sushi, von Willebrand factor type A, EGF and pentraxin domain-containing protein 1 isoform X2 [Phycodurus eques]
MELLFLLGSSTHSKLTSLLFFCCCCFVWRSEADCPMPQRGENTVLSDQALLMNTFPEGSNVTLVCSNGFEKESGSDGISCQAGNWTRIELLCKKINCGVPKSQLNMKFNTSAGTLFGDVVKVTCDKGYQISGSSYKQCYSWGWMGKAKCHIKTCKKPAEVTNGKNSWDSKVLPTYGQVILYNCDEGYTLTGNDTIQCSETGEYDSLPPECKGGFPRFADVSPSTSQSTTSQSTTAAAAQRDKIITGGAEVTTRRDGGHALTTEEAVGTAASNVTPWPTSFFPETYDAATDAKKKDIVVCTGALCLHLCLLRRKGSYDTREDVKPEFLLFQNV